MATIPIIALIDQTNQINFDYLSRIAAAYQRQITEDFFPEWGKDAKIIAYHQESDIPTDAWICYFMVELPGNSAGLNGYHSYIFNENGAKKPVIYVLYHTDYERTASHEILETLEDPFVDNLMLVKATDASRGSIELLVEVSDPVQSSEFGYKIDEIPVSNFFYRSFYDPFAQKGVKYDHLGWLTKPRQLLDGGYISFKDAAGVWWQAFNTGNQITYKKLLDKDSSLTAREQIRAVQLIGIIFLLIIIFIGFYKLIKRKKHGKS